MRIFLDECVNRRLAARLTGHDVSTAHSMRWLGLADSTVLRRCEGRFDVYVTADTNLRFQQDLREFSFGVVVLRTRGGSTDLAAAAAATLGAVRQAHPGQAIEVDVV